MPAPKPIDEVKKAKILDRLANQAVPVDPLLNTDEVCALLGLRRRHFEIIVKDGQFPAPIRLGRLRRWRSTEITQFLETTPRVSNSHAA